MARGTTLRPGNLVHLMDVQSQAISAGSFPGESWSSVGSVWCSLEPLSYRESLALGRPTGNLSYRARCWHTDFIDSKCRLVEDGRTYQVVSCINVDDANVELEMLLEEEHA